MGNLRNRRAFTLIEVLIVIVIMAVLAATIIPQFSSSTTDAMESSLKFNMHTMRSQIELYKIHHLGNYPTIQAASLPQLTGATNVSGTVGDAGADFPYGPYVDNELPANPFNNSSDVTAGTGAAFIDDGTGWQYDATTGGIWPNNEEYYPAAPAS